jgi:GAF domain-containing protein
MKKYYTTEQMSSLLNELIVGDDITSEEVELFEQTAIRLSSQVEQIRLLLNRLELAERVIGELYLMQREYEE